MMIYDIFMMFVYASVKIQQSPEVSAIGETALPKAGGLRQQALSTSRSGSRDPAAG